MAVTGSDRRADTPGTSRSRRASDSRIDQQPAFVLHTYPWRETSLIIDLLTRDHGRVALVAKGAKRPTSQFRGLLSVFSPLKVSWSGRGDIKTLVRAEWVGGIAPLRGAELLSAFYVNELIVRLLARGDPHENLFFAYAGILRDLGDGRRARDGVLHAFELDLLREIGVAPSFDACADGSPVHDQGRYRIDPEQGVLSVRDLDNPASGVNGLSMRVLAARDAEAILADAGARSVLHQLISYHLRGRPLNTHRILSDLKAI